MKDYFVVASTDDGTKSFMVKAPDSVNAFELARRELVKMKIGDFTIMKFHRVK